MNKKLLSIIVCPQCKGKLRFQRKTKEFICDTDALAFPVRNGFPVLLVSDARALKQPVETKS